MSLNGSAFALALLASLFMVGAYGPGHFRRDATRLFTGTALASLLVLYVQIWTNPRTLGFFAALTLLVGSALTLSRLLVNAAVQWFRPPVAAGRAVLVTYLGGDWTALGRFLARSKEFVVVGTVPWQHDGGGDAPTKLATLEETIERTDADTVLLWAELSDCEFRAVVDVALAEGCRLLTAPRSPMRLGLEPRAVWIDDQVLTELIAPGLRVWQLSLKRLLDAAGALALLAVLSPLLICLAVWIKLDSPGPVLFVQDRVGAWGRLFGCLKFRSMRADAEAVLRADPALRKMYDENDFKLPANKDPRLTRVGRLLRKTSLDELPQLINVLRGDMSLVGPRPIVPDEIRHYGSGAALFLSLKPGMTGAWAVSGRSHVGYPDRADIELDYVRRWSVLKDLKILLHTVPAVLTRRGAF